MPLHSESRRVMNKPNLQMSVPNFSPRVDRLLAFDLICQGRWCLPLSKVSTTYFWLFLLKKSKSRRTGPLPDSEFKFDRVQVQYEIGSSEAGSVLETKQQRAAGLGRSLTP